MAIVKIVKQSFDDKDGKPVEYERLGIIGQIAGKTHTLLLKLTPAELLAEQMLLSSKEEPLQVTTSKATGDELLTPVRKKSENILSEVDPNEDWLG